MKKRKTCQECKWWNKTSGLSYEDKTWGRCHRYPQSHQKSMDDFCGEFIEADRKGKGINK